MSDNSVPLPSGNKLAGTLSDLLAAGNCKEALKYIRESQSVQVLKDTAWDIIPIITQHLVEETVHKYPDMYECCIDLLEEIVDKAQPEEVLLELIEQAECLDNDVKFIAILKPMQKCLNKLPVKRGRSLEWCLNTIQNHLVCLPVPENNNLEGKERKLMDFDPCHVRIISMYRAVMQFYKPFVHEVRCQMEDSSADSEAMERVDSQRKSLVCIIVQLLGKPLMHLDLELDGAKGNARVIAEELVSDLSSLIGDLLMFLQIAENREIDERCKRAELRPSDYASDDIQDLYQREDKVPTMSIAVLQYLLFAEEICIDQVPRVYSPLYIWQVSLYLATALLRRTDSEDFIVRKGLLMSRSITSRLSDASVPSDVLDSAIHPHFCEALTTTSIFCQSLETRKLSIEILKSYLFKFDMKGRYLLMSNLRNSVDHSSLIGYLTMQLKDMIIVALNMQPMPPYFHGKRLSHLLKQYIILPDGPKSDLADIRDQVLASLNVLMFLFTRDRSNQTGIWDYVESFQEWLLLPLKTGIDMSRAHFKQKLKELEADKASGKKTGYEEKSNVSVSIVGGGDLPELDEENMTNVLHFALNGFDLMESTLVLVQKRIETGPSK